MSIPDGRRRTLGALASMPADRMAERYRGLGAGLPEALPVRGPEVGLVMLTGRTGGGGAPFKLGEASVTRATVRLASGQVGQSMILGRDMEKARMVAHLDALWQHPDWRSAIERDLVDEALALQAEADQVLADETAATRVEFFTLARGED